MQLNCVVMFEIILSMLNQQDLKAIDKVVDKAIDRKVGKIVTKALGDFFVEILAPYLDEHVEKRFDRLEKRKGGGFILSTNYA